MQMLCALAIIILLDLKRHGSLVPGPLLAAHSWMESIHASSSPALCISSRKSKRSSRTGVPGQSPACAIAIALIVVVVVAARTVCLLVFFVRILALRRSGARHHCHAHHCSATFTLRGEGGRYSISTLGCATNSSDHFLKRRFPRYMFTVAAALMPLNRETTQTQQAKD